MLMMTYMWSFEAPTADANNETRRRQRSGGRHFALTVDPWKGDIDLVDGVPSAGGTMNSSNRPCTNRPSFAVSQLKPSAHRHKRPWLLGLCFALACLLPLSALAKPWGVLVSEDGSKRIALEDDEVVVGSAETATARIEHETVSARHAMIRHDKGVVTVVELGSRYGTLFAGTELRKGKPIRVVDRTLLTFGAVTWAFEFGERSLIPPTRAADKREAKDGDAKVKGKSGDKPAVAGRGKKATKGRDEQ